MNTELKPAVIKCHVCKTAECQKLHACCKLAISLGARKCPVCLRDFDLLQSVAIYLGNIN